MTLHRSLLLSLLFIAGCGPTGNAAAPPSVGSPERGDAAGPAACMAAVIQDLHLAWPNNRTINIVAFGHSVPAGFGVTPAVHKQDAYPRLLENALADAYPNAVLNVITSAVGGEDSTQGLSRFQHDVLDHHPRVILIDYALNDRALPLEASERNLSSMVDAARAAGACPVLLTPTWDEHAHPERSDDPLRRQADMIHRLAARTHVPVADSFAMFQAYKGDRNALMAQFNHPNRRGHELVLAALLPLFMTGPAS